MGVSSGAFYILRKSNLITGKTTLTNPTRIAATFAELKSSGHMAFMPFLTAGDPDIPTTLRLIQEFAGRSVDLIELGFPYSDPIADGPVIQASYTRALNNGLKVHDIFDGVRSLPTDELPPLVAMVSYAIIFRTGNQKFVEQAKTAGFSGFIVPDLPADEAEEFAELVKSIGLDLIQLISPTTPEERAKNILSTASGFVYVISVAGTTGVRDELPPELSGQLQWLRENTDLPLAVGFGISNPDHVDILRGQADGIIVGSAIVRQVEQIGENGDATIESVGQYAQEMVAATRK